MFKKYSFIDNQNLYLGIRAQDWELDYKRFHVYLKEKYGVDKSILYIGYIRENEKLYRYLRYCGFEIVFKNTKQYGQSRRQVKGNIDVDLAVDTIRRIDEYSDAVFVSADGDFCALYDFLIDERNKRVEIIIPDENKYSSFLKKYRNSLSFMNDLGIKLGK
jgi:uncharacterized LabA/DUF88 family protein